MNGSVMIHEAQLQETLHPSFRSSEMKTNTQLTVTDHKRNVLDTCIETQLQIIINVSILALGVL